MVTREMSTSDNHVDQHSRLLQLISTRSEYLQQLQHLQMSARQFPPYHYQSVSQSRSLRREVDHEREEDRSQRRQREESFPVVHRVYNIRCSHCDAFFSDRGMRAVLLLNPNITLFSTDATPINCGQLGLNVNERVERTCDCLTETMGCYGCGNPIGYHIVVPCHKCTKSVSKNQRAANGHRYVFHYGEVRYQVRTYRQGDLDIRPNAMRQILAPATPKSMPSTPHLPQLPQFPDPDSKDCLMEVDKPSWSVAETLEAIPATAPIKQNDVVYWHHLIFAGERKVPVDPKTYRPPIDVGR